MIAYSRVGKRKIIYNTRFKYLLYFFSISVKHNAYVAMSTASRYPFSLLFRSPWRLSWSRTWDSYEKQKTVGKCSTHPLQALLLDGCWADLDHN